MARVARIQQLLYGREERKRKYLNIDGVKGKWCELKKKNRRALL